MKMNKRWQKMNKRMHFEDIRKIYPFDKLQKSQIWG
jgi:hypothetical protein